MTLILLLIVRPIPNVDKAEDDADFAELLNAKAVRNLAEAMKAADGTLIHISTDYVFGQEAYHICLFYTSDAADDLICVGLRG